MNQPEIAHEAGAKREKTLWKKSELVFVLFLIYRESGASFFLNQSQRVVMQS